MARVACSNHFAGGDGHGLATMYYPVFTPIPQVRLYSCLVPDTKEVPL